MLQLGNNAHLFARPSRRQDLAWCFETALQCGPVRSVTHPGMPEPMLLVDFPGGGHLSIEFVEQAPDDELPRLGAWLELRADDPAETMRSAVAAGLKEVKHPGHPYYVVTPGGHLHHRAGRLRLEPVLETRELISGGHKQANRTTRDDDGATSSCCMILSASGRLTSAEQLSAALRRE